MSVILAVVVVLVVGAVELFVKTVEVDDDVVAVVVVFVDGSSI